MQRSTHAASKSWGLTLAALGVVYGDIGTSPLYALRECFGEGRYHAGDAVTVLGPVSLMIWSFLIIVSIKYLLLLCRATNQGEGGVFALLSILRQPEAGFGTKASRWFGTLAILGAALMYSDGAITPAISVLSAVEGLKEINPDFSAYIIPIAVVIILGLFLVQRHGTHRLGASFGPIMLLWFSSLGILGAVNLAANPDALVALSPHYGWRYLLEHGRHGIGIMGAVLLCVTGCEALYADIGHFGATAMRRSWFFLALPSLSLNYLGQAAVTLANPSAVEHPFYRMVPSFLLVPMVILATLATIIASQAMITGVFSLTQQAVQLGYLPRITVKHTNSRIRGQIYLPQVSILLCLACLVLVFTFKSSSALAAAYGLSVSANMVLTSGLFFFVMHRVWKWAWWQAALPVLIFLSWELCYLAGSLSKLLHGAWMPVLATVGIWIVMKTWQEGRAALYRTIKRQQIPVQHLLDEIDKGVIPRVRGTAVFLSGTSEGLPLILLNHLKHNKALHERLVLLTVQFHEIPHVPGEDRVVATELAPDFHRIVLHYGFMETPDVMDVLCRHFGYKKRYEMSSMSFYQARERLLTTGRRTPMAQWRKQLFAFLSRAARPATGYFDLPPRQVIEFGLHTEI